MRNLEERMAIANELLEPYAVPHEGTLGRVHEGSPESTRFPFERDADRIVYSEEYRRLKGKTQVFVGGKSDHYRTRLTHTMQVANVSRRIARALGLNEDLAECIALAHDLGHPPFGHSGEEALNDWMKTHNLSFEHNQQSLRIVEFLSYHSPVFRGLNLNREVLHGLMKHRTPYDTPAESDIGLPSLEALDTDMSDEIAYTSHDVDDGLEEGLFTLDELMDIPLIGKYNPQHQEKRLGSIITDALVTDVLAETDAQLQQQNIQTLDDVYMHADRPVRFSDSMQNDLSVLRTFLRENMYFHPKVLSKADEGKRIVTALCNHLMTNPTDEVLHLSEYRNEPIVVAIKDYVSGMTDHYATEMAVRLGLLS